MKEELEQKLKDRYPQLLGSLPYFECGDGWYNILSAMCYRIQLNIDRKVKEGNNDPNLLEFKFVQIKEKFGGLRAYTHGRDEYSDAVIDMAESMAAVTCENCGSPGSIRKGGWWGCRCDNCQSEWKKIRGITEDEKDSNKDKED